MYKFEKGQLISPSCHLNCHILSTCTALTLSSRLGWKLCLFSFTCFRLAEFSLFVVIQIVQKVKNSPICCVAWDFDKHTWCMWKKLILFWSSPAAKAVTPIFCPLVSSEVQPVNDKWGDVFLHLTQLDAHILHQYSEVNAMHLTASKNNLFYVVHQFFKAFFFL